MSDEKLDALIAKLEAASEGSAELDAEIAAHLGWRYDHVREAWASPDGLDLWHCEPPRHRKTRSLDAALTLVPEGWYGRIWFGFLPPHIKHNNNRASIWSPHSGEEAAFFGPSGNAATAALALCIAALKARRHAP